MRERKVGIGAVVALACTGCTNQELASAFVIFMVAMVAIATWIVASRPVECADGACGDDDDDYNDCLEMAAPNAVDGDAEQDDSDRDADYGGNDYAGDDRAPGHNNPHEHE
jgi:hypothetical protein